MVSDRGYIGQIHHEVRKFTVAVHGGVEHARLRERVVHETDNWIIITDCSDSINEVLAQVATCVSVLTTFRGSSATGEKSAGVFFRIDSGGHRAIAYSREV